MQLYDLVTNRESPPTMEENTRDKQLTNVVRVYEGDVLPSAGSIGNNYRTLFIWDRSVFQLVYKDFIAYYVLHIGLTLLYEYALSKEQQGNFDQVSFFFRGGFPDLNAFMVDAIVMITGFLLSMAIGRYFSVNYALPGVQRVLIVYIYGLKTSVNFAGKSRWIEKYANLILLKWALTFRMVSRPFRVKYPTIASLQAIQMNGAPLLNDYERQMLEDCERRNQATGLLVYRWCLTLLRQTMFQKGFLDAATASKSIEALHVYKKACGYVMKFVSRNIPLAVTQIVLITAYNFGILCLLGRPFNSSDRIVRGLYGYFPFWSSAILFMFFSWLKVAMVIANPFGKDRQDIDCIAMFNDHIKCISDHVFYANNQIDQLTFMEMSECEMSVQRNNRSGEAEL